jgi:flagellar basal-body rod modification protein FlgD
MALDGVSGRVYREAAIPGISDLTTSTTTALSDGSGTKSFPKLTPAESAANATAAGATPSKTDSSGNPLTGAAGGALDKTAFLKLLVQELTNQDPLKPADNTQFIAQLAQFSTLEQMQNLNTGFEALKNTFQTSEASGLLGKQVSGVNAGTGANVDGVVDKIIMNADGSIQVDVSGTPIALSEVVSISPAGAAATTPTSGSTSSSPLPGTLVPPTGTTSTGSGTGGT